MGDDRLFWCVLPLSVPLSFGDVELD